MANKRNHLSFEERFCIEKMLSIGSSFIFISRVLGRGESTISNEIKTNGGIRRYKAKEAQDRSYMKQYSKKSKYNKVLLDKDLKAFVKRKLKKGLSPDMISSLLKKKTNITYASSKSIRKYIKLKPFLYK